MNVDAIEICNLRVEKPKYEYDVKVDRTSPLGNPFRISHSMNRQKVIKMYKMYYYEKFELFGDIAFHKERERLIKLLLKHKKLRLFCWCTPEKCHAEIIADDIMKKTLKY